MNGSHFNACIEISASRTAKDRSRSTQPEVHASSPEHHAIVIETLMEVGAMIDRLPEKVRKAFVMAQIQGLPTPDIADALAVSHR